MAKRILWAAALFASAPVMAAKFVIVNPAPAQEDFHAIARDTAAAFDYKALEPSDAGGLSGFALGAYGTYAPTRDSHAWERTTGVKLDQIGVVGVNARKGLPLGIDVGGFYGFVPGADAHVYGGNLRYAVLPGSTVLPALALRGSYTGSSNLGNVSYHSYGLDASVSKGLLLFTPYAGLGYVWANFRADGNFGLRPENIDRVKGFAGLRFSLALLEATAEYERLGGNNAFSARLGLSF